MTEGGWGEKACQDFDETLLRTPVEDAEHHSTQNEMFHCTLAESGIPVVNEK